MPLVLAVAMECCTPWRIIARLTAFIPLQSSMCRYIIAAGARPVRGKRTNINIPIVYSAGNYGTTEVRRKLKSLD
ncbi:hypothetical protein BJX99DRAFT_84267 [Aspergillus californicus]